MMNRSRIVGLGSSAIIRRRGKGLLPALITAVFALPALSWGQISLVRATACGPGGFPITCAIPATGSGHLIVVGLQLTKGVGAGTTISSIGDNAGNAYFEAGSARASDNSSGYVSDIWYAKNSAAGATAVTITPSAGVSTAAAVFWEFSGVDTTSPLDQSVALSSQPATTTPTGGSVTTLAGSDAIVSIAVVQSCLTGIVAGNPFTSDSALLCNGWAHLVTSAAGTYAAQWNQSPTGTYIASTAAFKVASGVSGTFSPCDLNKDGTVNSADVTVAVNLVLSAPPTCTAVINGAGSCNAAVVQRVIAATLPGGTCHPVSLSWSPSPSQNVSGYNVYRSVTSNSGYVKLNSSLLNGTTYTDATSQPGTTYYYVATAVDISGNESAFSAPPSTAPIPSP